MQRTNGANWRIAGVLSPTNASRASPASPAAGWPTPNASGRSTSAERRWRLILSAGLEQAELDPSDTTMLRRLGDPDGHRRHPAARVCPPAAPPPPRALLDVLSRPVVLRDCPCAYRHLRRSHPAGDKCRGLSSRMWERRAVWGYGGRRCAARLEHGLVPYRLCDMAFSLRRQT